MQQLFIVVLWLINFCTNNCCQTPTSYAFVITAYFIFFLSRTTLFFEFFLLFEFYLTIFSPLRCDRTTPLRSDLTLRFFTGPCLRANGKTNKTISNSIRNEATSRKTTCGKTVKSVNGSMKRPSRIDEIYQTFLNEARGEKDEPAVLRKAEPSAQPYRERSAYDPATRKQFLILINQKCRMSKPCKRTLYSRKKSVDRVHWRIIKTSALYNWNFVTNNKRLTTTTFGTIN